MNGAMSKVGQWLRPPRNLLILFVLVVCLPALSLIGLGIRLLDQDRVLARQRALEILDRAADQGVRVLEQDFADRTRRLAGQACTLNDAPDDSVCIFFQADRIEAIPVGRLPYYPVARVLKEAPVEPFQELESNEFREPVHLDKALDLSRQLAASKDAAVRAGALLRQGRIFRRMGRPAQALAAYDDLGRIESISIDQEPVDLLARRTRCDILQEQSRADDLRREAAALAADLHAGKWQLDQGTFLNLDRKLQTWLGPANGTGSDHGELLASAALWIYEQRAAAGAERSVAENGVHIVRSDDAAATVIWTSANGRAAAFIAGPRYLESHWISDLRKAVFPAQPYLVGTGDGNPQGTLKIQRTAADTGLPWGIVVANEPGQPEPQELAVRRRNLMAGLGALVVLIAAGSYFILRAVNRELAVARLQSDFVSAVSHEFRTPLTTLRQFNELLAEDDGPTPEKRRAFYQAQSRATERLHRLVESVLDFGRMEEGRRPYHFQPLDAAVFTHDVTDEFRLETNGQGFTVNCSSDSGPHPVSADPDALSRALWNLLDNAVKYSGNSRNVGVEVSRKNGSVSIAVRDHGIGIPASEQKAVFQKFVRGAASISGGIRGTGLGLAMVRHIVEAHSGTVNLQSQEGRGSIFTIVLPARST
jgi:signal transduction histidine kinase